MDKVITSFSKESFDLVALSLPPNNSNSILETPDLLSAELDSYLTSTKKYRKGENERVIYERVNEMK